MLRDDDGFSGMPPVEEYVLMVDSEHRYPDLNFSYQYSPNFEASDTAEQERIVRGALQHLFQVTQASMPEGTFPAFSNYNENTLRRINKFLAVVIMPPDPAKLREKPITRRSAIRRDSVIDTMLEELSVTNNPVYQLIESLRRDHETNLGKIALYDVADEILIMTYPSRYRHIIDEQVAEYKQRPDFQAQRSLDPINLPGKWNGTLKPDPVQQHRKRDEDSYSGEKPKRAADKTTPPAKKTTAKAPRPHDRPNARASQNSRSKNTRQPSEGHKRDKRRKNHGNRHD